MHFNVENCQYEVLEVKDLVFTFDFIHEHLLKAKDDTFEDKYNETELRTIGWPVALSDDQSNRSFAMLRPVKQQYAGPQGF